MADDPSMARKRKPVGRACFLSMMGERGLTTECFSHPIYYRSLGRSYQEDFVRVKRDNEVLAVYSLNLMDTWFTEGMMRQELDNQEQKRDGRREEE